MMKLFVIVILSSLSFKSFAQPVAFAPLPNAPMGEALCFAYNSSANRIWAGTATKVFYSDNNGATWVNTASTGTSSLSAIALNSLGTPYIITSENGMRHFNGTAWVADNNGLPVNPMPQFSSLAIDAAGNVYAGAGWHGLPPNYSGVWKWNGTVWSTMNTGLPTAPVSPSPEITSLAIDASGNLFAGTARVLLNGGGQGFGVYKWSGSSWNSFGSGLSNLNVASLGINTSGELFAGTFNTISHISAAAGGAWVNSTVGLPAFPTTVRSITFDVLNNVYAGLGYLPEQAGSLFGAVYISNNNGASWAQSNAIANTTTAINAMVTDNAGNIFAGATGIYKSANQGTSWLIDTVGLIKVRAKGGAVAINSMGHIFSAGDGAVFKSIDAGVTWQLIINGIDRHDLSCIAVDKNDNLYLGGQIWVGGSVRTDSGRVWKSTDGGNNWLKTSVHDNRILEFKITPNNNVYVALTFGSNGNNASYTIDGTNWLPLNTGNSRGAGAFAIDVNQRNHIFIGTEIGQVRRSVDGGVSFTSSTNLLPGNIGLVRVSPHDLVFCSGGTAFGTPSLSYSDSINNGVTFTQATNFPVGKNITDIIFDNQDSMYVGTQNGLYTTTMPFNPATSKFTLNASNGLASVKSFAKDPCGYLYISNYFAPITKSTMPVEVTPACNVLPVTFFNFSGAYNPSTNLVYLQWVVNHETNTRLYTIEKSSDGLHFYKLDTVRAAGNINQVKSYYYTDASPYSVLNYYRLSQTDLNGSSKTLHTILIKADDKATGQFRIYPNPGQDILHIRFPETVGVKYLTVETIQGKKVLTVTLNASQLAHDISVHSLPFGFYFVKLIIADSGETIIKKILKN